MAAFGEAGLGTHKVVGRGWAVCLRGAHGIMRCRSCIVLYRAQLRRLLEFQPCFQRAAEFRTDFDTLERKVMLADASQCIEASSNPATTILHCCRCSCRSV
jgi:hypothetical protein